MYCFYAGSQGRVAGLNADSLISSVASALHVCPPRRCRVYKSPFCPTRRQHRSRNSYASKPASNITRVVDEALDRDNSRSVSPQSLIRVVSEQRNFDQIALKLSVLHPVRGDSSSVDIGFIHS